MTNNKFSLNSFLSLGGSDGPGVRSVIFLQGCPLRCDYCHNPETLEFKSPDTDIASLVDKVTRFKSYYKDGGGVTVSGGEPLCQQDTLIEFFKLLKANDIHTCIDTSAGVKIKQDLLEYTDLILCDIKFLSNEEYKLYTSSTVFDNVLDLLEITKQNDTKLWIRHVLYPDVTDNEEYVLRIKELCSDYPNIERIELLPFKNICQSKYDNLGIPFKMADVKLISNEKLKQLRALV